MSTAEHIALIGGGVVGLACARVLQRDGHRVTVFDPSPADEQSAAWGSAGILTPDMLSPLATPEMLPRLPAMVLRDDSALALRWAHVPRAMPWLARFAWNGRPASAERNARALASICSQALAAWHELLEPGDAASLIRPGGWVFAYESDAGMAAARRGLERRLRHGARAQWLDGGALRERVPQLARHVVGGLWFPEAEVCVDPAGLLRRLAARIEAGGGSFRAVGVTALEPGSGGVGVRAGADCERFDRAVVCTGAHSRALARTLGDDFPLDTERGYHVMLAAGGGPALAVMSGEHHFVTTPMAAGVRLAGTSELGGLSRPPDPNRFALLRRQAARLFPGLDTAGGSEWMGFRPTLPDSRPIIGPSPRHPAVWYALGHQHLGLTLAAVTGRMIADAFAGRPSRVDRAPFRLDRF